MILLHINGFIKISTAHSSIVGTGGNAANNIRSKETSFLMIWYIYSMPVILKQSPKVILQEQAFKLRNLFQIRMIPL